MHQAVQTLAVVIPCWRDFSALARILDRIHTLAGIAEVVVADASPGEECRALAAHRGATVVQCSRPSRGMQMNAGAGAATADWLLFQHADTDLRQAHVDAIHSAARSVPHLAGGAFHRLFDCRHPSLGWLEPLSRAWVEGGGTIYGDQSFFVRTEVFRSIGGYAPIPLMEDVEFSRRLRAAGRIALLDPPISSSPRDSLRRGSWRTTVRNLFLLCLYHLGVCPEALHRWYYRPPPGADPGSV